MSGFDEEVKRKTVCLDSYILYDRTAIALDEALVTCG